MPVAVALEKMTAEEFLTLPEDDMDRSLIHGELKEKPTTVRNRFHSRIMIRAGRILDQWLDTQPKPRGQILGGEAGVRLRGAGDSVVGIDVVYVSAEVIAKQTSSSTIVDGVPILAVEILSPSDTMEELDEKIDLYREAGVPLIWIIDPRHRTIEIFAANAEPESVNINGELSGEPYLPGFRIQVREIFS